MHRNGVFDIIQEKRERVNTRVEDRNEVLNGRSNLGHIDQYELLRELGGGGFGCVYLARDTVSDVDVAVKGLPPLVRNNKDELENIRRNFALVSRLTHENIAFVFGAIFLAGAFYLIFVGLLTILFGKLEKKLDYFKA